MPFGNELAGKSLDGEGYAHTCAIVDEKCFRIYSDRFPLCWFESILMLARNDMINEGSRIDRVTGARNMLIHVKDIPLLSHYLTDIGNGINYWTSGYHKRLLPDVYKTTLMRS